MSFLDKPKKLHKIDKLGNRAELRTGGIRTDEYAEFTDINDEKEML